MLEETIAAIATPLGEGGLAVIRLSGSGAFSLMDRIFVPVGKSSRNPSEAPTHTLHYGRILHAGRMVDEVIIAVMRAPRTFTREDVVEISCHGGLLPAKLVLDAVLAEGARLALPGEFTKRAFLNGRIDLAQAEAVADLIHSRTEVALAAAHEQLSGKLSQRINQLRDDMIKILAHVEAYIDFPDEDISPATKEDLLKRLESGLVFMDSLLSTANEGQLLRRGIRAAIVGRPNAGKSSLLNHLLGHERAIVSPIPGTTRDTIEESANIRGLLIVFVDTAGLRESGDALEAEGIRRSHESLARAELILHVLDLSESLTAADERYLQEFAAKKRILVGNKADLPRKLFLPQVPSESNFPGPGMTFFPSPQASPLVRGSSAACGTREVGGASEQPVTKATVVEVSCLNATGLEALKDAIKNMVWRGEIGTEMLQVMINSRHQEALQRARLATQQTVASLREDLTLELAAMDLRIAVNAVGEIVGKTTTEDLLDSIFGQFCIGK